MLLHIVNLAVILIDLDTDLESCEKERGILKRRLAASAVEIERQVSRSPD